MKLTILTPDKYIFSGGVESITVPSLDGFLTILPNHLDMIAVLKKGAVSFLPYHIESSALDAFSDHKHYLEIEGGICKVVNDEIVLTLAPLEQKL